MRHACLHTIGLLLLTLLPRPTLAQTETDWQELMQQLTEETVEAEDQQQWDSEMEVLEELHEQPLDINRATREQLLALPFLDERSADAILNYVLVNGPLRSLGELQLIPEVGVRQRVWLRSVVRVGTYQPEETSRRRPTTWWGRPEHELLTRFDMPFYERQGWGWSRGIAHRLRYHGKLGEHFDYGLRAEKDAGEPMFCRQTPLWDAYGGHLMLQDAGALRRIIVGDYKAGFGEGLVMNNGLRLGKLSMGLWRSQSGIRPHRSTDEVNFLRGAAAELSLGRRGRLTALYSYRKLDASVADDNTVQTAATTGLHRTDSELAGKGTLGSHTTALNADWEGKSWLAGATAMYQHYDHQFRQGEALYRRYYPEGYRFGAMGVHYRYHSTYLLVSGETAASTTLGGAPDGDVPSPALSTINKATWRLTPATQLSAIQRFYSKSYYSPYASTYGENSHVRNESGLTLQFDTEQLRPLVLRAYVDYFYSPWPRYTMTRSSAGWKGLLQATWRLHRRRTLLLRYSIKSKEQSDRRHLGHRLRATYSTTLSQRWSAQLSTFAHLHILPATSGAAAAGRETSTGLALAPRADYTTADGRLRLSLLTALFRTTDYNSRIYLYEPSLLQSFGMLMIYGRGQRLATALRWRTDNRRWNIQLKAGITHYNDRKTISSGPMLIRSPWKADLQLLLQLHLPK